MRVEAIKRHEKLIPPLKTLFNTRRQSFGEEVANCISHGTAALVTIVLGPALVLAVSQLGDPLHTLGASIFVTAAVLLYLTSTLYHSLPHGRAKQVFQILDHSTIFVMIAGTYTPFMLAGRPNPSNFALLAVVWCVAITGIAVKVIWGARWPRTSTACFLLLGWLSIFVLPERFAEMPPSGTLLTVVGGIAYTLGVPFFAIEGIRYAHFVWHLFVLAGTSSHALVIWRYLN